MPRPTQNPRKFRFTQRAVEALPPHDPDSPSREAEYCDAEVVGLRLLVSKTGRKFFYARVTVASGRRKLIRIGEFPSTTLADARKRANEIKGAVAKGEDPTADKERRKESVTLEKFAEDSYLVFAQDHKRSWKDDRNRVNQLKNKLAPGLMALTLDAVSTKDVRLLHARLRAEISQVSANRFLALLRRMLGLAQEWGHLAGPNPCDGIKLYRENPAKERYLSEEELRGLLAGLAADENRLQAGAVGLLLATGLRKSEVLGLSWPNVDLEAASAFLPMTKSGRSRRVPLNAAAVEVLKEMEKLREKGNDHVFPGPGKLGRLEGVRGAFERAKGRAGIEGFRLHDARHNFASSLVQEGVPLLQVQSLLGHGSPRMTMRYAHLADDGLRRASEVMAGKLRDASGA